MPFQFVSPALPLLVFTDLDGTLLDHDSYSHAPAQPALARLRHYRVPVIPTTSKTLAEVADLVGGQLALPYPCIVENGGALCLPPDYFAAAPAGSRQLGYQVIPLAPDYDRLRKTLDRLRERHGFRFRGFHDMSVAEVAGDTGLPESAAAQARQRMCSEPLQWLDSEPRLAEFGRAIEQAGLRLTRGGRYWHVMGPTDKGVALRRLCDLYRQAGFTDFTTVALGDSPNDAEMLGAADIAVAIRRPDGAWLDCAGARQTLRSAAPGPQGWNDTMLALLDQFTAVTGVDPG